MILIFDLARGRRHMSVPSSWRSRFSKGSTGFCDKYYPELHQLYVQNWQASDCKAHEKPGPEDYQHIYIFFLKLSYLGCSRNLLVDLLIGDISGSICSNLRGNLYQLFWFLFHDSVPLPCSGHLSWQLLYVCSERAGEWKGSLLCRMRKMFNTTGSWQSLYLCLYQCKEPDLNTPSAERDAELHLPFHSKTETIFQTFDSLIVQCPKMILIQIAYIIWSLYHLPNGLHLTIWIAISPAPPSPACSKHYLKFENPG